MKKVIVTGGTGFLGRRVCQRLKTAGYIPHAIGRNQAAGKKLEDEGIAFFQADLRDVRQTLAALRAAEGVNYVIHCAALSAPWGKRADFVAANVQATENVLTACEAFGIKRLVHISTPSLYFNYEHRLMIKECDPLPFPVNDYADTKREAEKLVLASAVPSVILRPRAIFGPGDTTLFPRLLRAWNRLPLIDEGQALMDITYIDNVVDAIFLAMYSPLAVGQCYNITNDDSQRFIDLMQMLSKKLECTFIPKLISFRKGYALAKLLEWVYTILPGKEPPLTCYTLGVLAKSMTLDIAKAKSELGYAPAISIEQGMDHFVQWWRQQ